MKSIKRYSSVYIIVLFYIGLMIFYFCKFTELENSRGDWGTFGDFMGGSLSPLIGIISIILTYRVINNQIMQDRQTEFKYMFEILFAAMSDKKQYIKIKELVGNEALKRINKDIEGVYKKFVKSKISATPKKNISSAFWSVHDDLQGCSGPFMKNIHNCLKAIDKHCLDSHKKEYSDLLRAQLSREELVFIFYNGIGDDDFQSFKDRIEKYSLLKDVHNYPFEPELKELYSDNSFKDDPDQDSFKLLSIFKKNFKIEIKFSRN